MRDFGPWKRAENLDTWWKRAGRRTCSFCGSLHPDEFMSGVRDQTFQVGPTDKDYKAYVETADGGHIAKFYYLHLSEEQRQEFTDIYNTKAMRIGYPGYFYVWPFFWGPKRPVESDGLTEPA